MAFKRYIAKAQGFRANQPSYITISETRIGLGALKLPFEYVQIHYDQDIPAIKFVEGTSGNGFKIISNKSSYSLSAKSFTRQNLIPLGLYYRNSPPDEYIFTLVPPQGDN